MPKAENWHYGEKGRRNSGSQPPRGGCGCFGASAFGVLGLLAGIIAVILH